MAGLGVGLPGAAVVPRREILGVGLLCKLGVIRTRLSVPRCPSSSHGQSYSYIATNDRSVHCLFIFMFTLYILWSMY